MTDLLGSGLSLPCGLVLPNRLAKAAMTEGLADPHGRPTAELQRLYRTWGEGGCGLLITGNVQVDADHLERAGNVVIATEPDDAMRAALQDYAAAAKSGGSRVIMQLSHAGRQTPEPINPHPGAPSAIKVKAPPVMPFGTPRALEEHEIAEVEDAFVRASRVARDTGFDGVQIHAAHGYLLSAFLSPLANRREDRFGGSLENRAALLLSIVRRVREACPPPFAVSVKLNSADFQRGGFDLSDSERVARWLDEAGVDLIEISGGNYEQSAMMGDAGDNGPAGVGAQSRTAAREAYFLAFAPRIRACLTTAKLMVTGGFRSREGMVRAISNDGVDVIGIARPLVSHPSAAAAVLAGSDLPRIEDELRIGPGPFGPQSRFKLFKMLNVGGAQLWYYDQLERLGRGEGIDAKRRILPAMRAYRRRDAEKLAAMQEARRN